MVCITCIRYFGVPAENSDFLSRDLQEQLLEERGLVGPVVTHMFQMTLKHHEESQGPFPSPLPAHIYPFITALLNGKFQEVWGFMFIVFTAESLVL